MKKKIELVCFWICWAACSFTITVETGSPCLSAMSVQGGLVTPRFGGWNHLSWVEISAFMDVSIVCTGGRGVSTVPVGSFLQFNALNPNKASPCQNSRKSEPGSGPGVGGCPPSRRGIPYGNPKANLKYLSLIVIDMEKKENKMSFNHKPCLSKILK